MRLNDTYEQGYSWALCRHFFGGLPLATIQEQIKELKTPVFASGAEAALYKIATDKKKKKPVDTRKILIVAGSLEEARKFLQTIKVKMEEAVYITHRSQVQGRVGCTVYLVGSWRKKFQTSKERTSIVNDLKMHNEVWKIDHA